jgi:6-phosphogluconate dehydrogenase
MNQAQVKTASQIGVIGLGVMGMALARNFAGRGHRVAGFDRDVERAKALAGNHPDARLAIADDLPRFVESLERPRQIIVLVNAGAPVDRVLEGLDPLLAPGDVVVDAGNSRAQDTEARLERFAGRPWRLMGMGVSGGEHGALTGPAFMPGGHREAYDVLARLLTDAAAMGTGGPCVTWCGQGGAGHFVKTVHNGIEYGDMELIAEAELMLRRGLGMSAAQAADVFSRWDDGPLSSFLVELTAEILRVPDTLSQDGTPLVDHVLDRAGQKGTGAWTVAAAAELGVAVPTLCAAVDARLQSADRDLRLRAALLLGPKDPTALPSPLGITPEELGDALYAAKIASYTQGFALLAKANAVKGYQTNLAEVARVWTAGCIIRARVLEPIRQAFIEAPDAELLALTPAFVAELRPRLAALRRAVVAATGAGLPVPAFAASLTWFDGLVTARGVGALIQAQRDAFGAHTYERSDRPGVAVHSNWLSH